MVAYVTFLCDVACQKLLNSADVSRSYSRNNTGTVFLRHGEIAALWAVLGTVCKLYSLSLNSGY